MKLTEALEQLKGTKAFILQAEYTFNFIVVHNGILYPFYNDGFTQIPFEQVFQELEAGNHAYLCASTERFEGDWENVTIYQVRPEF